MRPRSVLAYMMLLSAAGFLCSQQVAEAGTQSMIARRGYHAIVIDGVLGPEEWSRAIPIHVKANPLGDPPGIVPSSVAQPDNQDDCSFTLRAMYDDDNLYVAVQVSDGTMINDGPMPWFDDDVEIFVDGDRKPGDAEQGVITGQSNLEGFQLITTVGSNRLNVPENLPASMWESAAGPSPRGYVVEVRISFDSINTHDTSPWTGGTPGFRRPEPGDQIGFNVTVGDDDSGGGSYAYPNSYIAWDGSRSNWYVFDETAWGTLYLAPSRGNAEKNVAPAARAPMAPGDAAATRPWSARVSPSPLRGLGTLGFTLAEAGPVSVGLYDASGRFVRTLGNDAWAGAGRQELKIDRRGLAPGIYLYRIDSATGSTSGRLVVVD